MKLFGYAESSLSNKGNEIRDMVSISVATIFDSHTCLGPTYASRSGNHTHSQVRKIT